MDALKLTEGSQEVKVAHSADIGVARRLGILMVEAIGFNKVECAKIELVIRELGSNIVKHAGIGSIVFSQIKNDDLKGIQGIQIESIDEGPGIKNIEQAFKDGYTTTDGLGYGLGTINRVMDEIDITLNRNSGIGTHLVCKRWLQNSMNVSVKSKLDIGVASRPHPLMTENGDDFFIKQWASGAFIALIDGVGHGEKASIAAKRAVNYVKDHYQQSFQSIIKGLDRTCRSTRGVVLTMIRFDLENRTFQYTGIGNIEIKTLGYAGPKGFITRRGIIGSQIPEPLIKEFNWDTNVVLIIHTDGIPVRWKPGDYEVILYGASSFESARRLVRDLAKEDDDATVLVIKEFDERKE